MTALPRSRPLTADDLEQLPDDGHRYELVDGALVVTPSPAPRHQLASSRLLRLLDETCPPDLVVLTAPCDVRLAEDTVLQPDLLVTQRAPVVANAAITSILLAVEITSPSTRRLDLHTKRVRYQDAGCPSYWVIDPDVPSLTLWELEGDRYLEVGHVEGGDNWRADRPFDAGISPSELVR